MPRPLRLDAPGATHHVMARGNRKQSIFLDDKDYRFFLTLFGDIAGELGWQVFSYCLMPNHYHLLFRTPEANLAAGMRRINSRFSQAANWRHENTGHMFQDRYKSILVKDERQMLVLMRYIALNPVKAGLVSKPEDWAWSNHRTFLPAAAAGTLPGWLDRDIVLSHFKRPDTDGRAEYCQFVADGIDKIPALEKDLATTETGRSLLRQEPDMDDKILRELLTGRHTRPEPEHPMEYYQQTRAGRGEAMAAAWLIGGHRQVDIAEFFGVHPSTVAHAVRNYRARVTGQDA